MTTATTPRRPGPGPALRSRGIRDALARIDASEQTASHYRELAALALKLSTGSDAMADEARRFERAAVEFEEDADEGRDLALRLGFDPADEDELEPEDRGAYLRPEEVGR